ncbi:type II toxin-antitoxin system VapC family toxin [Rhodovulum sp. PH10]|uniref:type II toxin-antitoxin system VapC family toxin n=1 Tax=Rhodovulum sp. PH10 TaxID=1187851 RepID=UPI0005907116|nr:PIN domain-containing protein [Rhodovulum sp. PH10]
MIVVDANFLVVMLDPIAMPHIVKGRERIELFVADLSRNREEVMIPAPVIAEIVAGRVDQVDEIIESLRRNRAFNVQPFDEVVAIEAGLLIRAAVARTPPGQRAPGWKVAMKFDAMVAATAKVWNARAVCTDDGGIAKYLAGTEIEVIKIADLPLPPEDAQGCLALDPPPADVSATKSLHRNADLSDLPPGEDGESLRDPLDL